MPDVHIAPTGEPMVKLHIKTDDKARIPGCRTATWQNIIRHKVSEE